MCKVSIIKILYLFIRKLKKFDKKIQTFKFRYAFRVNKFTYFLQIG